MSYEANFQSALSYLKLGDVQKAVESLNRVYEQIPVPEKTRENAVYLKTVSLLARFGLEQKSKERVWGLVNEGLGVKDDHVDLLFLKALLLLDEHRFDEMLVMLVSYLLHAPSAEDIQTYRYELLGDKFEAEIFGNLLPAAYREAPSGPVIRDRLMALTNKSDLVHRALNVMHGETSAT